MLQQSCAHPYTRCDHFAELSILTMRYITLAIVRQAGIRYANHSRRLALGRVAVGNWNNVAGYHSSGMISPACLTLTNKRREQQ